MQEIRFDGAKVQLFPDLSWLTLQQYRLLQPLLAFFKDHSIRYRWGFLSVSLVGEMADPRRCEFQKTLPLFVQT